ncbi:MAG TPA: primosomal replication protein N, partial [Tissierellales bacterium]|nr:primosomal replication protein N [Tissierellales bacterium]
MGFKLETTDMDLGDTPIENIFLNDFMPMANGTYVKVYLLGYKYAHDRDASLELTNQTIARHLDVPLEDVLRAWDFWENKGIVEKSGEDDVNYQIKFLSLKQLYIRNNLMAKPVQVKKEEKA